MKHTLKNPANNFAMLLMALAMAFAACEEKAKPSAGNTFTDSRDGKTYKIVKIGEQVWMAENLNFKTENSWCYDNNEANCQKYGRLYNQKTAMKACPSGWHLPSKEEWDSLVEMAGGKEIAGKKLKSKTGWNDNGNGTDEFGFSALPGGCNDCMPSDGFAMVGEIGYWWEMPHEYDGFRDMGSEDQFTGGSGANVYSVRCVKD
jgi:uncharacterized protein (TIGR02145 family)